MPRVVEAVRTRDRTIVTRLAWGALAFLKEGALVGAGAEVQTPYGQGVVRTVERIKGMYEIQLDWGARLYSHPSQIVRSPSM
jgi:hypothetical protein